MLTLSSKLNPKALTKSFTMAPLRDGYGEGIVSAGLKNKNIVVLCADLASSTRSDDFQQQFPDRFFEVGVAEQNLAAVAAGMSLGGKIPFISSYATFSPGRNLEQIRTTICYNNTNVKIAGHHAGISVGPDGATHQALEDIALMRTLPNMKVIVPVDALEAEKATIASTHLSSPVYIRLTRAGTPVITTPATPFVPGRAYSLWQPTGRKSVDVTIIGAGPILHKALLAAKELETKKIYVDVINLHTIKPLDKDTILSAVKKSQAVVTVEEHQIAGGVGSTVAEFLAQNLPTPIEFVGVKDSFGQSGTPAELIKRYELDADSIIKAVNKVIKRK